jgi:signal transduction histidine kinase
MRRRILAAILGVTTVAVVLFGVPLAVVIGRLVDEGATLRLERQAVLASRTVPIGFATSGDPVELPPQSDGIAIGLYDTKGTLVAGLGPSAADDLTSGALANQVTSAESGESRIVAVPIAVNEEVVGAIRVEQSTAAGDSTAHRLLGLLVGIAIAVLGVGGLIGWFVAGKLTRPVLRIRDAAVQLGGGDFAIDVTDTNVLELDQVGRAVTATARRLDELISKERLFSSDVSHQLRTPVAGLRTAIETELAFPRSDRAEVLHEAITDLDRLERTISELLAIARTPGGEDSPVSVAEVLERTEARWQRPFARAGRPLKVRSARFVPAVWGSPAALAHALDVLVDNALRHGAGEVRLDHTVGDEFVTLRVSDEGPGFGSELDTTSGGESPETTHGLGQQLAQRLVESMSGRMVISRRGPSPMIDVILRRADTTVPDS